MNRTRDWRRAQFIKRRERDYRLINSLFPPSGIKCKEERLHNNYESIKKGGLKRCWLIRYWRDDPWFHWLQEDKKKKKDRPLDKELEAWYNDEYEDLEDDYDEAFLREVGMID